jgi:hypothetical protein
MIGDPPWSLISPETTIKKIRNAPLRSTIGNAAVQTANEYEYRFAEYEYRFAEYEYRFAEYEYEDDEI